MALLDIFDVSGSAMAAQTVRLNTVASNIANAESVASDPADTYRARRPVFSEWLTSALDDAGDGRGVHVAGIVEDTAPLARRYEPGHPFADDGGYVTYPNVNVVQEMADMMSASRSFQINVEVMNTARTLAERVLTLGQ